MSEAEVMTDEVKLPKKCWDQTVRDLATYCDSTTKAHAKGKEGLVDHMVKRRWRFSPSAQVDEAAIMHTRRLIRNEHTRSAQALDCITGS